MLVDNLLLWARDSKNRLIFLDRPEKYHLFWQPELYLTPQTEGKATIEGPVEDDARNNIIEVRSLRYILVGKTSFVLRSYFSLIFLSLIHI